MGAVGIVHTTRWPTERSVTAVADRDDRAGALVADDVRRRGHLAAEAVERVAALDADRLHLDEHAAGWTVGSGTSS